MKRNILLFFVLVGLSVLLAMPFGSFVNKYIFPSGSWSIPDSVGNFIDGFPFLYSFLAPILYIVWGRNRVLISVIVSMLPIILFYFYIGADAPILVWSSIFFVSGAVLSVIVRYIINLPMVINK